MAPPAVEGQETCFVCDEAPSEARGELLRLCKCKVAHGACKAGYRQLHKGSVHEVFCTECRAMHETLPTHVSEDASRGAHHVALVSLRLPHCKPQRCAVISSTEGGQQLQGIAHEQTGWAGPWRLSSFCQVGASEHFAQIDGWRQWPWVVYCIAGTQARHGSGHHWLELVRDVTENSGGNFSLV